MQTWPLVVRPVTTKILRVVQNLQEYLRHIIIRMLKRAEQAVLQALGLTMQLQKVAS